MTAVDTAADVCPVDHDALKADAAAFAALVDQLGTCSIDYEDGGAVENFVCANCSCGTTLYRRCTEAEATKAALAHVARLMTGGGL